MQQLIDNDEALADGLIEHAREDARYHAELAAEHRAEALADHWP
jgi:hypothetical protein